MNAILSMPLKEVAEPLTVQDKFKITRHELSRSLIERQSEIDLALTCLLANAEPTRPVWPFVLLGLDLVSNFQALSESEFVLL